MKSNDEKNDDGSRLAPEERRLKTDAVLKELLQVTPPMSPDLPTDESKATEAFVVPDYLIVEVARNKKVYPNASDEELANILKNS